MMKTAIVTGASGNLGKAVVDNFLLQGFTVIGTIRSNDPADKNASNLELIPVDLTDEKASQLFVENVTNKYSRIDTAVLTVGGFAAGDIVATSSTDIQQQYKLNFETAYNIARPVFQQMMKQNDGRIFLIGSRPGLTAASSKGMVAYGLAKALIFRLAELLNEEGKKFNVVTSVIVPSTIDTPENRKAMPDADTGKWVKAKDIASVIGYYCSDEAATLREPVIKVYGNS